LKTDFEGLPIAFNLTGGETSDSTYFETLMNLGPDVDPRAAVADKGYDSAANRAIARERGAVPVIPYRKNTKVIPKHFAAALYRGRARIEQAVGKLDTRKNLLRKWVSVIHSSERDKDGDHGAAQPFRPFGAS